MSPLAGFAAQVGAEVRSRLRSPATLVALVVVAVGAFFWIPSPTGKAASITWRGADGLVYAPEHNAAYLGVAMAMLSGIVLAIFGFYLVVGAIGRDRRSGLGVLLAATPLSNLSYLAAKVAAHAAYLGILALAALPVGIYQFARFGVGELKIVPFLAPLLLLVPPSILFVATMAVLFEVTPGLKGKFGWVFWFLTLGLWLGVIPLALARDNETGRLERIPWFDPSGALALDVLIERSIDDIEPQSLSTGLIFHSKPPVRVPWRGFPIPPSLVAARAMNGVVCALLLGLALVLFDRFDPARARLSLRRRKGGGEKGVAESPSVPPSAAASPLALAGLRRVAVRPTAWGAITAEARITGLMAGWLRVPLVGLALAAVFVPAPAGPYLALGFLLVLGLVVAEAPARESLAGAGPLVFSQPSVPPSPTLWKLASLALFSFVVGAPLLVKSFVESPVRGVAFATGLVAFAGFAAAFGTLSGGGKLFSVLLLALLYGLVNGAPALDLCGVLGGASSPLARLVYLGAAGLSVGIAMARERQLAAR